MKVISKKDYTSKLKLKKLCIKKKKDFFLVKEESRVSGTSTAFIAQTDEFSKKEDHYHHHFEHFDI